MTEVVTFGLPYADIEHPSHPFSDTGIPPDIEIVTRQRYNILPGGSAVNAARRLSELGVQDVAYVGVIGESGDHFGDMLVTLFEEKMPNIQATLVRAPGVQTNLSNNYTNASGKHLMLADIPAGDAFTTEAMLSPILNAARGARFLYAGSCLKMESFVEGFEELPDRISDATRLVVDHGRVPDTLSPRLSETIKQFVLRSSIYIPSMQELLDFWGGPSVKDVLQMLHDEAPTLTVVVKDGKYGAHYLENGEVQDVPTESIENVDDATGLGDAFNGGYLAATIAGKSNRVAIGLANGVTRAILRGQPLSPRLV